jgi:hypothetical protein
MLLKCFVLMLRTAMFVAITWHAFMPENGPKAAERTEAPDPLELGS